MPWSRALEAIGTGAIGAQAACFLGTVRPDGRPHSAGIGVAELDGDLYFTSGPGAEGAQPGVQPGLHIVDAPRGPRPRRRRRRGAGDRPGHARARRRGVPRRRLAGAGRRRRAHRALQRAKRPAPPWQVYRLRSTPPSGLRRASRSGPAAGGSAPAALRPPDMRRRASQKGPAFTSTLAPRRPSARSGRRLPGSARRSVPSIAIRCPRPITCGCMQTVSSPPSSLLVHPVELALSSSRAPRSAALRPSSTDRS